MTGAAGSAACGGGIFFDLDGTLVDTAPDMVAVLTGLQKDNGSEPVPYELARASVSHGALGLIRLAFPAAGEPERSRLLREFLERYEQAVCVDSTLFPGMPELLALLDSHGQPWGVVTNKPERMTEPLLRKLGLSERISCAVSGDTLPQRKRRRALPKYLRRGRCKRYRGRTRRRDDDDRRRLRLHCRGGQPGAVGGRLRCRRHAGTRQIDP